MKTKFKQLFCRHRYDYRTNYLSLNGVRLYVYVCPLCGKHKLSKKQLDL